VLVQTGILLLAVGLLAELLTRIYMDGRQRKIYTVAHAGKRMQPGAWNEPRPVIVDDMPALIQ
jgi:hypothetical protein